MAEMLKTLGAGTLVDDYTAGDAHITVSSAIWPEGVPLSTTPTYSVAIVVGVGPAYPVYTVTGVAIVSGNYVLAITLEVGTDQNAAAGRRVVEVVTSRGLTALISQGGLLGVLSPDQFCTGAGTEGSPFVSTDATAGFQTVIGLLASGRGGKVNLSVARYDLTAAGGVRISSPSICIESPVAGFNVEPNGLTQGVNGMKLHSTTHGIRLGVTGSKLGGILLRNLYLWGPATGGAHDGLAIDFDVDQPRLENLNISNFAKAIDVTSVCDAGHLSHLCLLGNGYGIYIDTTGNAGYSKIEGCEISDNLNSGVVDVSSVSDYLRIENCTLVRNANALTTNGANVFFGSNFSILVGSTIRDAGHNLLAATFVRASGIIVAANFCAITGNVIASNQTGAGIFLGGDWNIVASNSFGEGNAFDVVIGGTGNQVDAPASPSIVDAGADSIINRVPSLLLAYTIAAWSTFMSTLIPAQTDRIGGTDAVKIVPNVVLDFHSAFLPIAIGGPQGSVFIVIAKSSGYHWMRLTMQFAAADHGGWVDLDAGTVGTVDAGVVVQIFPLADGWNAVLLFSTNASTVLGINVGDQDNAGAFAGTGTDGILVWRPYAADTDRQ